MLDITYEYPPYAHELANQANALASTARQHVHKDGAVLVFVGPYVFKVGGHYLITPAGVKCDYVMLDRNFHSYRQGVYRLIYWDLFYAH